MNCSMPGFPVHHHLPELAQTHVHWVGDAIQLCHLLPLPSPLALNFGRFQTNYDNQEAPHPTSLSDCPSHLTPSAPTMNQPYSCEYSKFCLTLMPLFCPLFVKLCVGKTFCPTWIHLPSYARTPQLWAVNHSLLGLVIKSHLMLSACSVNTWLSPLIIVPLLSFVGRVCQTGDRGGRGFACWSWRAPRTEAAAGAASPTPGAPGGDSVVQCLQKDISSWAVFFLTP